MPFAPTNFRSQTAALAVYPGGGRNILPASSDSRLNHKRWFDIKEGWKKIETIYPACQHPCPVFLPSPLFLENFAMGVDEPIPSSPRE
ncbi:MAG TPA: hypothetical protein ACFYD6_05580 [Candidatus Brocadiia bacterium]|nr:hypothetical protein [Planctomycetota bacterium]MDO8091959.1 hypothetical protein [Candidatus Brocadiales bacterium]